MKGRFFSKGYNFWGCECNSVWGIPRSSAAASEGSSRATAIDLATAPSTPKVSSKGLQNLPKPPAPKPRPKVDQGAKLVPSKARPKITQATTSTAIVSAKSSPRSSAELIKAVPTIVLDSENRDETFVPKGVNIEIQPLIFQQLLIDRNCSVFAPQGQYSLPQRQLNFGRSIISIDFHNVLDKHQISNKRVLYPLEGDHSIRAIQRQRLWSSSDHHKFRSFRLEETISGGILQYIASRQDRDHADRGWDRLGWQARRASHSLSTIRRNQPNPHRRQGTHLHKVL